MINYKNSDNNGNNEGNDKNSNVVKRVQNQGQIDQNHILRLDVDLVFLLPTLRKYLPVN